MFTHKKNRVILRLCSKNKNIFAKKRTLRSKIVCVLVWLCVSFNRSRLRSSYFINTTVFSLSQKTKFLFGSKDGWMVEPHDGGRKKELVVRCDNGKKWLCSVSSMFQTSRCFGKMQTVCVSLFFRLSFGLLQKMELCSHWKEEKKYFRRNWGGREKNRNV